MGAAGRPAWDAIARMVEAAEPRIHASSLWAMARVSALPCEPCVNRLNGVVSRGHEDGPLAVEAQVARSYFEGAGRD